MKLKLYIIFFSILASACHIPLNDFKSNTISYDIGSSHFQGATSVPLATDDCNNEQICQVKDIINKIRVANNLAPLTTSTECEQAAQWHAVDMAQNNYFSHNSADGKTPGDRVRSFGGIFSGENIALGQINAQEVCLAWMNSPQHRENILSTNHSTTGIGLAINKDNQIVWVQEFCN